MTTGFETQWKILVVDDDTAILSVIEKLLSRESYLVDTAQNASDGWEKLNQMTGGYDFMILDRLMPEIDGMELLRRIKADPSHQAMPIIMQSGAASPEEIAEGIEAGAYYYLAKPFASKSLLSIVRAVSADIRMRNEVAAQAAKYIESLKHFTRAELEFFTLEDINCVVGVLAAMCPDPESASSGLLELLLNAVEHGNLGITYEEKKQLMLDDVWEQEVRRRLLLPRYAGRVGTVFFTRGDDALEFRITDQGGGFQWEQYLELDPQRSLDPNGRGIAMARRLSFSKVEYFGCGNTVVATIAI